MKHEIISLAKQFRLSVLTSGSFQTTGDLSNEEYLLEVLRAERTAREERAAGERLRQARLPAFKSFEEFDTEFQKGVTRKQLDLLAGLEWIDGLYNLILIGPPGTGKTHTALAIGGGAAQHGYNVAFHTMDGLVHLPKLAPFCLTVTVFPSML